MKIVFTGKSSIIKLMGKQRIKRETLYRRNMYLLSAECEDGLLLYNVISGQMVLLDNSELLMLNKLPAFIKDIKGFDSLIEGYFLVPVSFDEKNYVDALRNILKKMAETKGINGYTILPTTMCNAKCFYCYQADYHHINMSAETANALVDYMVDHKGDGKLALAWFGGEPLVGISRINQICDALNARGVSFTSSMISNGYLFDEATISTAVSKWKLNTIQISLDGTEEIYNAVKAYTYSEVSPYKRVMYNIGLLADNGIRVGIRLNLGQHNISNMDELITDIKELRENHGNITAYVHTLFDGEGYIPTKTDSRMKNQLYNVCAELNLKLIDMGLNNYRFRLPTIRIHSCMADNPKSVVVYPDGSLFQCEHTVPDDVFGSIFSDNYNKNNFEKFFYPALLTKCSTCPLYPTCIILKECEGLADRNPIICDYDISSYSMSVYHAYINHKDKMKQAKQS